MVSNTLIIYSNGEEDVYCPYDIMLSPSSIEVFSESNILRVTAYVNSAALHDITRLARYDHPISKHDCLIEVERIGEDSTTVAELLGVLVNNLSIEGYSYNSFSNITEVKVKLVMFYDVFHLLED